MAEELILTFTGRDAPGITAQLTRVLAQAGARLNDVEQVVVQGLLTLGFAVEVDEAEPVLKNLLFAAKGLGLQLEFRRVAKGHELPRERYALTVIARTLGPAALQAVAEALAAHQAIDEIRKSRRVDDMHTRLAGREMDD